MTSYYDVTLDFDLGSKLDPDNDQCIIEITYVDPPIGAIYPARVFKLLSKSVVQVSSAETDIEAAWNGANGGTLTINFSGGVLTAVIVALSKVSIEVVDSPTRLEFVHSLELAAPANVLNLSGVPLTFLTDGKDKGFVDAGSVVSFVGNVSADRQADVLNSMLIAQLAANKKFKRESETEEWYAFYRNVLENVGWGITNFGFQRYEESSATLRMDKAALELIGVITSGNQLAILTKAVAALGKLGEDGKPAVIFDGNGSTGENGNFQAATCSQDANGNIQTSFGAFYFKADKHVGRFLFWSWETRSINMYFSTQNLILNEQIYATVRDSIVQKLGSNAAKFVDGLEI